MFRTENITKHWKEAGSFAAQINLYGFWDEHAFITKSGDLGAALRIGGVDYESLSGSAQDYTVKRIEAAFRSLDDKTRLYQILFKRNHPVIPHGEYDNPVVRAAIESRARFLESKSDRLYSIEIFWIVMIDGSYQKRSFLHALSQLPKQPRSSLRDLRALFSGNKERTLLYQQIERDRMRLQQKVNSLSGQLSDLMKIELSGAKTTFRLVRRLVNFRPAKINNSSLRSMRHLDRQMCDSELEAHRGHLRIDDDYVRVLTQLITRSTFKGDLMRPAPIIPLLLGLAATVAHGQQTTARIVKYHANDIVNVRGKMSYTTLIQLPPTEKILDAATGDKDFWIVDTVGNYCFVHPAKAGIHSSLDLITDRGSVYSFTLDEAGPADPDLKIVIEPSDQSLLAAASNAGKLVSASEVIAAQEQARLAQTHAATAVEQFRADYPIKALKFDYTYRNENPFDVSAIYHDDKFTYIKSSATEKFSIYELKDKKPDLITFQLLDGTYVIPTVVDHG